MMACNTLANHKYCSLKAFSICIANVYEKKKRIENINVLEIVFTNFVQAHISEGCVCTSRSHQFSYRAGTMFTFHKEWFTHCALTPMEDIRVTLLSRRGSIFIQLCGEKKSLRNTVKSVKLYEESFESIFTLNVDYFCYINYTLFNFRLPYR